MNRAVRLGVARFKNDPNYRPDLVPAGFAPHPAPEHDDSAILKRIVIAYQKAKAEQPHTSETFKVSNEWLPIYTRTLGGVMQALQQGNLTELNRMYSNFFRDPCSYGLFGFPLNIQKHLFKPDSARKYRDIALTDFLHRHDLWKQRTHNAYGMRDLVTPDIGNPYGCMLNGTFIRGGTDYQHYYAQAITSLLPPGKKSVVLELGGGFGGMAYFLVRDNPQAVYIDLDLPETLALASYYLLKAFPDVPATLFGEAELSPETLGHSRIVMMPSFQILKMESKSVDLAFNSYSLAEMSPSAIREYIAELARCTSSHILHVNHNRDAILTADNFGIEDHGFKLINKELAGWTSGINPSSDEFEYLYKAE